MNVPEIDVTAARELLTAGTTTFVDIRDPHSYEQSHIPGAVHLDDSNVEQFVADTDKQTDIVVYCYRGQSSLGATAFLTEQKFASVRSMTGGYTAWEAAGAPSEASPS